MKAIIILHNGEQVPNEEGFVSKLAAVITTATNCTSIDVTTMTGKEVANSLLNALNTTKVDKKETISPELIELEKLCVDIIEKTGSVALKCKEIATKDLCKYIAIVAGPNTTDLFKLIGSINSADKYVKHRRILNKYGLSCLPEIVRDMNPYFKLY